MAQRLSKTKGTVYSEIKNIFIYFTYFGGGYSHIHIYLYLVWV